MFVKSVIKQFLYGTNAANKYELYCNHCGKDIGIEGMVAIERTPNKIWAICYKCGTTIKQLTKVEQSYFKDSQWDGDGYIKFLSSKEMLEIEQEEEKEHISYHKQDDTFYPELQESLKCSESIPKHDTTFLYTLVKLAKEYGWKGNYNEIINFVIWCHDKFSTVNPELDSLLKEKRCS